MAQYSGGAYGTLGTNGTLGGGTHKITSSFRECGCSKATPPNPSTETQTSGPQRKRNATQGRSHNSKYVRLQKSRVPRLSVLWVLTRKKAHSCGSAHFDCRSSAPAAEPSAQPIGVFALSAACAWRSGAVAHRQRLEPSPNFSDGSALRCVTAAAVAFYCVSRSIPSLRVAGSARRQ